MDKWWNDYVGLPYKLCGRDRDGIDCYGLVELIQREVFGKELKECETKSVEVEELTTGDIITIPSLSGGRLSFRHCGIVTAPGWVLHATKAAGTIHQPLKGDRHKLIRGAYRVVG